MKVFAIVLALCLILACSRVPDAPPAKNVQEDRREEQYKKELDEVKKTIKGEVKIKLKKDAKGDYSWEITGKDANEVLKVNDTFTRRLGK